MVAVGCVQLLKHRSCLFYFAPQRRGVNRQTIAVSSPNDEHGAGVFSLSIILLTSFLPRGDGNKANVLPPHVPLHGGYEAAAGTDKARHNRPRGVPKAAVRRHNKLRQRQWVEPSMPRGRNDDGETGQHRRVVRREGLWGLNKK